ncbi:type II secretion system F family protein [Pragia fontium]|uniref:Tight adherance operon protein n=1 Tax=Pragia fontium TaxID=82985 RepID=A0ABQ5LIA8_9GAMM|nr:type II secretion system F family protein [Pragia fontium]GKX63310.1 tight adherance operon protein [Pragia fontium]SUB81325.1 Flp pilus assembly protein TadB [Pragia fontium]VEJ53504.1 Flp pilus assembly protein TadB [Pragia fontium]
MTIIFYLVLVLLGGAFLFILIRERQYVQRIKKTIDGEDIELQVIRTPTREYESLIESNNKIIGFFSELDKKVNYKLAIIIGVALLLFLLSELNILSLDLNTGALIITLILVAVIVLPDMIRKLLIKSKTKIMMDDMPYFIDLVAVCVQAGMTVESALKYVAEHFGNINPDLAKTLDRVVRRAEVKGLESALKELYYTLPTLEIKMFCTALQQSVFFGTSVYEQLMDLSKDIRDLQLLSTEEKVGNLSAKMSVPLILLVMFPIVVLIAAPGLLRILSNV